MRNAINSILPRNRFWLLLTGLFLLIANTGLADANHYKNVLVGDRAATMGGAYNAVSDDPTGVYYNPAGLAFGYGDSLSGSGNAYHSANTTYTEAIADQDWNRDSTAVLPNFFGMIKKFGSFTVALAYIIPDSIIEHQEQQLDVSATHAEVDKYYLSLHSEDRTNLVGPAMALQLGENFSIGVSFLLSNRLYRHQKHEFVIYQDDTVETTHESVKIEETAIIPKLGVQFSLFQPFFFGLTVSQPSLMVRSRYMDSSIIEQDGSYDLFKGVYNEAQNYPTQVTFGASWFPSPSWLFVTDIDYYSAVDDLQAVTNIAVGGEWFLSPSNVVRFGYFTNKDNREPCTPSSCNEAKLDMSGATLGYSSYTRASSFTLGAIYSTGSGKAAIYTGSSQTVDVARQSVTFIFAAGYTY